MALFERSTLLPVTPSWESLSLVGLNSNSHKWPCRKNPMAERCVWRPLRRCIWHLCQIPLHPLWLIAILGRKSHPFQFRCITPLGGTTICCLLVAPAIDQTGPGLVEAPIWFSTSNLGAQNRSVRSGYAQTFWVTPFKQSCGVLMKRSGPYGFPLPVQGPKTTA